MPGLEGARFELGWNSRRLIFLFDHRRKTQQSLARVPEVGKGGVLESIGSRPYDAASNTSRAASRSLLRASKDHMPGQSILLIEDDREISSTIQKVLEHAGYKVAAANNGVDGRRLADNLRPDLVITDMMMPRMGGFPVLEHLKSQPSPPRVIMITANEGGRHKAYAEMLGVDDYLRKPFPMDVLIETIERVLKSPPGKKASDPSDSPQR